jgi:hypothetical protein
MRQPHAVKASSPSVARVTPITASASSSPRVAVVWIQLVICPRFASGECSAT